MKKITVKYLKGTFDYYTDKAYDDINQGVNYARLMDDIYLAMAQNEYLAGYILSGAGIIDIQDADDQIKSGCYKSGCYIRVVSPDEDVEASESTISEMLIDDDSTHDITKIIDNDPVLQMYREALRIMLTSTDEIPESDKHSILAYLLAARALQCDNAADIDLFKMFLRGRELVVGKSDKYIHRKDD